MAEEKELTIMPVHQDDLTANIYGTGDLIIELKYCKWKVHREKFEKASSFFRKALQPDMWKEGRENYIKLHDDCPIMFARCTEFIYNGEYQSESHMREDYGMTTVAGTAPKLAELLRGRRLHVTDHPDSKNCEKYSWTYKARRDADFMPMTEKEMDLNIEHCRKYEQEVHALMNKLADKYGMVEMQKYSLAVYYVRGIGRYEALGRNKFLRNWECYEVLFESISKAYPDFDELDDKLKQVVAYGIARYCNVVTREDIVDDAAVGIRDWLWYDHDLCLMVMGQLAKLSPADVIQETDMQYEGESDHSQDSDWDMDSEGLDECSKEEEDSEKDEDRTHAE